MLNISVVVITRNDKDRVQKLAMNLLERFDEVVVFIDDRSEQDVAGALSGIDGCHAEMHKFNGFGEAKRAAVTAAKNDWIFSLDVDEMPDEICLDELEKIDLDNPAIYAVKRLNHYAGRAIKGCGWYPDYVTRIFHRKVAGFTEDKVHESVKRKDDRVQISKIKGDIYHYTYEDSRQFLNKVVQYASLYAENYQGKPKSVLLILLRAKWTFLKSYVLKKGLFYGKDGFFISLMAATAVFHKHWMASEKIRRESLDNI